MSSHTQTLLELQDHFIKERIDSVEKHFSNVCDQLSNYTLKLAHLRDAGDDIVKSVHSYATKENLNQTLKNALLRFSDIFSGLQDYREAQIHRLESKVLQELFSYGQICKHAREEVKRNLAARAKGLSKKQQLEKVKKKSPTNWQQITEAEDEYRQAETKAIESSKLIEKEIDAFEKNKIQDIKKIFLEFINIEMLYHSKALELYTKAYNSISAVKVDEDLEVFRNCLRTPSDQSRFELVRSTLSTGNFYKGMPPLNGHTKSQSYSKERPTSSSSSSKRKSFSESQSPSSVTNSSTVDEHNENF